LIHFYKRPSTIESRNRQRDTETLAANLRRRISEAQVSKNPTNLPQAGSV
jgi:hypothetical protein